jgi:hypothetical protein
MIAAISAFDSAIGLFPFRVFQYELLADVPFDPQRGGK